MKLEGDSGTPPVTGIKGTNSTAGKVSRTYELPRKETAMKMLSGITTTALAFVALTSLSSAQPAAREARLVEFDAGVSSPKCAPYCGTIAYDNNDLGEIVGSYTDTNIVLHGFLRLPNGQIILFDAPGAGHGLNQGTAAVAINNLGEIAGQFQDPNNVFHGLVRYPNGFFTTFDEPDAGTQANPSQSFFPGTMAFNINLRGTTAGIYIDASNVQHGFVRSPANKFISFDPVGSVFTFVCEETCLNLDGTVAGFYFDSSFVPHGFVRYANGTITSIDPPAPAGLTTIGTLAASINPQGVIAGYSLDSKLVFHGFVRRPDGSFITFDDPEAGTSTPPQGGFQGTAAFSINPWGAITGQYFDASNNAHGFERFPDGQFANFDAPHAGPGSAAGTRPSTNNAEGEVAGWYIDAGGLNHGFLWISGAPDR